jgi:nucleotide-binding universal stress UspA family protein
MSADVVDVVVVGVDGIEAGESSARALAWAMDFAAEHRCSLEVVTVWPTATAVMVHDVPGHCAPREDAWTAQRRILDQVRSARVAVPPVDRHLVNARPVDALVSRTSGRRLLVLGSDRSHGRGDGAGSIPARCGALAQCPVVVVRAPGAEVLALRDHRP